MRLTIASHSLYKGTDSLVPARRPGAAIPIATPSTTWSSAKKVSATDNAASKKKQIGIAAAGAASSSLSSGRGKVTIVRALSSSQNNKAQLHSDDRNTNNSISILWLKHDLRVDDHPGVAEALLSSSPCSHLLPLYVLDGAALPETCPGPCGAAALSGALDCLRAALRVRGSDLVVVRTREGETAASVVARAAKSLGAARVIAESEVSPQWRRELQKVQRELEREEEAEEGGEKKRKRKTELVEWSASLHAKPAKEEEIEGDWRKHAKARGPRLSPIDAPGALPPLPRGLAEALGIAGEQGTGSIPSAEEVLSVVADASSSSSSSNSSSSSSSSSSNSSSSLLNGSVLPYGSPQLSSDVAAARVYRGGESTARAALAAYVAGGTLLLDSSSSSSSSSAGPAAASAATPELATAIASAAEEADVPGAEGSSFAALFSASLALGTISTRRVAADAAAALARLPPFPSISVPRGSMRARAALRSAEASDFHRSLALSRAGEAAKGGGILCFFRWRGILTEFVLVEREDETVPSLGSVLLVHGFGAFGEHYRDASRELARRGYTVFAPTLPGYGRSEKVRKKKFFPLLSFRPTFFSSSSFY